MFLSLVTALWPARCEENKTFYFLNKQDIALIGVFSSLDQARVRPIMDLHKSVKTFLDINPLLQTNDFRLYSCSINHYTFHQGGEVG